MAMQTCQTSCYKSPKQEERISLLWMSKCPDSNLGISHLLDELAEGESSEHKGLAWQPAKVWRKVQKLLKFLGNWNVVCFSLSVNVLPQWDESPWIFWMVIMLRVDSWYTNYELTIACLPLGGDCFKARLCFDIWKSLLQPSTMLCS